MNSKFNEYSKYTQNNHNYNVFSNFTEIELFLKNIAFNKKIYFVYLNRKNIHKILYDEEKCLNIESKEENQNLIYIFYLNLLIKENTRIINYQYSSDYIESIFIKNKSEKEIFKKAIIAKIIIDLTYFLLNNLIKNKRYIKIIK